MLVFKKSFVVLSSFIFALSACTAQAPTNGEVKSIVSTTPVEAAKDSSQATASSKPSEESKKPILAPVETAKKTNPYFTAEIDTMKPKHKFNLNVAVIRGSGDVIPVARTKFIFQSYNSDVVIKVVESKNNAGPKPTMDDNKYKTDCRYADLCLTDYNKYFEDYNIWEKNAHAGLDQAYREANNGINSIEVTTDLTGEAEVELYPGTWYIYGDYETSLSRVYWTDVRIVVNDSLKKFELSNDNGSVYNK